MLFYAAVLFWIASSISNSEQSKTVGVRLNGKILAVGTDNYLWMRRGTAKSFQWIRVPGSCCVTQIHILSNGHILAVGTNRHLYIKKSLNGKWHHVPSSCCVKDVTTFKTKMCSREVIVGVGMNGRLYSKKTLNSRWVGPYAYSGTVKAVAGVSGQIYGIGMNNYIYKRPGLKGRWKIIPGSCCVKDIFVRDDIYTHLTYAVGTDNRLYTTALKDAKKVIWKFRGKHTCCIKSVHVKERPVNVKVLAVNNKNRLVFKESLNSGWYTVSDIKKLTKIVVLRNGNLLGIGFDRKMYIKSSIDSSSWRQVPRSCCVKSVAQLLDGRIIGVGMRNKLWIKIGLNGRWIPLSRRGSVTSITVDNYDRIIGIGMNRRLYVKRCFDPDWKGPLKYSGGTTDISFGKDGHLYAVGVNKRFDYSPLSVVFRL
eukprot:gene15348-6576_t